MAARSLAPPVHELDVMTIVAHANRWREGKSAGKR
jgi:hypothetical protein